MTNHSAKKIFT